MSIVSLKSLTLTLTLSTSLTLTLITTLTLTLTPSLPWQPRDNSTWSPGLEMHWIQWSETKQTWYFWNSVLTFNLLLFLSHHYHFNAKETLQLDFNSLNICDPCWYLILTYLGTYLYTYLSLVSCSVNFDISWRW